MPSEGSATRMVLLSSSCAANEASGENRAYIWKKKKRKQKQKVSTRLTNMSREQLSQRLVLTIFWPHREVIGSMTVFWAQKNDASPVVYILSQNVGCSKLSTTVSRSRATHSALPPAVSGAATKLG
eukprot:COSAG02_NODE_1122_length_14450_cov_4.124173_14_plen_126_part_00